MKWFFTLLLFAALAPAAHANSACSIHQGLLHDIAYCGVYSTGGGGGGGGGVDNRVPCGVYVAASGGSDSNPGTSSQPFATLAHAQTVVRGLVPPSNVVCLKAGTYTVTSSLTLTSPDAGEVWETDPASTIDSAILDGGGTVTPVFNFSGVSNVTINGITIQHFANIGIGIGEGTSQTNNGNIIENNVVGSSTTAPPVENAGQTAGIQIWASPTSQNNKILNNYVHDVGGSGIFAGAYTNYGVTNGINGTVISGNVVLRASQLSSDNGSIYVIMNQTGDNGGHVTVSNNFIRDMGGSGFSVLNDLYLDDNASNVTVTGNIFGPTLSGVASSDSEKYQNGFVHNGNNNTFQYNIFDLGSSGNLQIITYGVDSNSLNGLANNVVKNNLIVSSYPGGGVVGYGGQTGAPAADFIISNNDYQNFAGGTIRSDGSLIGDQSPSRLASGCTGYLYNIPANSPILAPPINFQLPSGGWGPPGFIIPTSTNHSCP